MRLDKEEGHTAINRQVLPGQTCRSSLKAFLPVSLSGQISNDEIMTARSQGEVISFSCTLTSAFGRCFDFATAFAARITRGFSNPTLMRSICWSVGMRSCVIRARTVQSSPPENRIAIRTLCDLSMPGGTGTSRTLSLSDSRKWCLKEVSGVDLALKG